MLPRDCAVWSDLNDSTSVSRLASSWLLYARWRSGTGQAERPGRCLQEKMSAVLAPLHLRLLCEVLADDCINGRLNDDRGYPISRSIALS